MSDKKKIGIALRANDAFVKDLSKALSVPPSVLLSVAQYVNTDTGMQIPDTEVLLQIWKKSGLSSEDLSDSFSVLKHIFEEAVKKDVKVDMVLQELEEFCRDRKISGFHDRVEALRAFLTPNHEYLKRMKFSDFAFGVVPNIHSISGVVQLRTAFADKKSTKIIGYVPLLQIRLKTMAHETDKEDLFVFQADEIGLRKLIKALKEYETQLMSMKKTLEKKVNIYTRPDKEEQK